MVHRVLVIAKDMHLVRQLTSLIPDLGAEIATPPIQPHELLSAAIVGVDSEASDPLQPVRDIRASEQVASLLACIGGQAEEEWIRAHDAGADDCIVSTLSAELLSAKIRRAFARAEALLECRILHMMRRLHGTVELTAIEQRLLWCFVESRGSVHSKTAICRWLWGEREVESKLLYEHVSTLRSKLLRCGFTITNVRGVGYRLEPTTAVSTRLAKATYDFSPRSG
ncbi:MAG TPA: winged helix-turn-helix domain-containing protein [Polyangiaceae bacterium]|nr:winged helix-turn-helix domain-containing protein [Polyangiaceae bacterium]